MMRDTRPKYGQVLVVFAIALLALLAFLALAIDLGGIYQERRAMQNAADAGALAGAREMCFGSAGTEAAAEAVALDYAVTRNGAAGATVSVSLPTSVTVVATQTYETYFAGLIGFDEVPVQADATAVCGRSEAVGDLWPVGFDFERWNQAEATQAITCGSKIIIWEGSNRVNCDELNCCVLYESANKATILDADLGCTEGWVPAIYPLDAAAWVDFTAGLTGEDPCQVDTSSGVGANEIKYRIDGVNNKGERCTPYLTLPYCYAGGVGNEGVASSGWSAAEDAGGRIVKIPLYDTCQSGEKGTTTECPPPDNQVCEITDSTSGGPERYWITGLACLQIGVVDPESPDPENPDWISIGYLRPFPAEGEEDVYNPSEAVKVIVATVPCENGVPPEECSTAPGWTTGDLAMPGDVKAVSLVD